VVALARRRLVEDWRQGAAGADEGPALSPLGKEKGGQGLTRLDSQGDLLGRPGIGPAGDYATAEATSTGVGTERRGTALQLSIPGNVLPAPGQVQESCSA
jgi:hypothetical protein